MLHRTSFRIVLLLLAVCTHVQVALGQFNRIFSADRELPNSLVNKVTEDSQDMIWIATEDGLCRFDGSSIRTYLADTNNPNSLQANFIRTLCSDNKGHMLIGTTTGIQMYRPATDDFTPVISNQKEGITAGNVNDICLLANGDFLIAGNTTYTIHINDAGEPEAQANAFTGLVSMSYRVCQDYVGNLWAIKFNEEVYRLDTHGTVWTIRPQETGSGFTTIGVGPDGGIYTAGLNRGIYKYNEDMGRFYEITLPEHHFSAREFCQIAGTKQMYVATDGEGIMVLNSNTGEITPYDFDDLLVDSRSIKVHSLCQSRNGELWMALYQKGVFVQARNPQNFHYFGPRSLRYNCIGDRCITSILRTKDGNLWIATDNGGLYSISDKGETLKHFPNNVAGSTVPGAFMNLFEDSRGRVWFGTYGEGGGIVDTKTGVCYYIPVSWQENGNRSNIYGFAEDKRGQIWVASMGSGILCYDEAKKTFRSAITEEYCSWSTTIVYDQASDRLYIGTYSGLVIVSLSEGEPKSEQVLAGKVISGISQFSNTKLALCSNEGLFIYDLPTGQYRQYTTEDGLINNNTFAALPDKEGNLWVSGSAGLSKFNIKQETFTNYTSKDGIQCSEFYKNSALRDTDDTLWFGSTGGITWFKASEIRQQSVHCQARIVGLHADQNAIHPDADGCYNIEEDDHSFTIELATRPIMLTSRVVYRYSMDGDPWQTLMPMLNTVSFSHLASGSHTFRFQAVCGGEASEVQSADIVIAYPWYRAWWIYLLMFAALVIVLQMLYQMRKEHVRERKATQYNEIQEAKMQLVMNVAHEFRTPMTLIVTPLQKLISTDPDPIRQRSYQLIDRNANRILNLINQLMDIRKISKAQMTLACRKTALMPQVRNQVELVSGAAEVRHITTTLTSELGEDLTMWLDTDCFEKILLNLLSNALKYTPDGGSVEVRCSRQDANEKYIEGSVAIDVTDTGVGIPDEEKPNIFDRFYQVRSTSKSSLSTGIGLNLVKALVELHHGEISVSDNPRGKGTRFTVILPLGSSVFAADECVERHFAAPAADQTVTTASILASAMREDTPVSQDGKVSSSRKQILVVDDDEEIRKYLVQELTPYFHVIDCSNGSIAMDMLLHENIDLVLSDVMMPVMDGIQLCQKIRGNVRMNHLPIILLTAKSSDEDRLKSLEIGANAFVTKPFNMEVLLQTIKNLLENQNRLRNTFSGHQVPSDKVDTPDLKSPDERLLDRVIKVVNDNLNNPELTSELIAQEVGLSRVHLYRKLKELTNQSARNYIRNIRLTKAAELLANKKMAVSEVAYQVGFTNPNNFATAFKELYGMSPTEYMNTKRESL